MVRQTRAFPRSDPVRGHERERGTRTAEVPTLEWVIQTTGAAAPVEPTTGRGMARSEAQGALGVTTPAVADVSAASRWRPDAELLRLHYAIEAKKSAPRAFALQFVAATRGEGTSVAAAGYALVAAIEARRTVLLLDADIGPWRVPALLDVLAESDDPGPALEPVPGVPGLHHARLSSGAMALDDGEALAHALERLRRRFDVIVVDCPAAEDDPSRLALARHMDGSVIVIRAGRAARTAVRRLQDDLLQSGGQVIGVVFDGQAGRRRSPSRVRTTEA